MNILTRLDPVDQIKAYFDFQYKVVRLNNEKKPVDLAWQKGWISQEDAIEWYKRGKNIGIQAGEVSGWLAFVDHDNPYTTKLADEFLPATLMGGKEQEEYPSLHVYRSEGAAYLQVKDIGGTEFLSFKASEDGAGHQVAVAPSIHREKGAYVWIPSFSPPAIADVGAEGITEKIRALCIAGLILKYLPKERSEGGGGRHEYSKAIAGTLLRRGYDPDTLAYIMDVVWRTATAPRDGIKNAAKNVYDTAQRIEDDKPFTANTTLNRDFTPGLADALISASGLTRITPLGMEEGTREDGETPDDSDLARRWLYKRKNMRHSPHGWMRYRGGFWEKIEDGLVSQDVLRFLDRAPVKVTDNRVKSVAGLASKHSYIRADAWDSNPDIVVCQNGTLDLNTFKLRDHRPEDYAMGALPFDYDPDAKAEAWNHFIGARLKPGEWEFLQEFVGYGLTTATDFETAVWLVGEGGTGKSTFVEGVLKIAGIRAGKLSLSDLERSPFALEQLVGKTLLTATEQPSAFIRQVDLINTIISGETLSINRKNKPIVEARSTAKILWAMNHLPQIREEGSGIFRRIFPLEFPPIEGERKPGVKQRITELEPPGILAWAIEGLKRLRGRDGFEVPTSVAEGAAAFEFSNDPPAQFLEEMCERGDMYKTTVAELYETYRKWCRFYSYKSKSKENIGADWKRLKLKDGRTGKGRYYHVRIRRDHPDYSRILQGLI